MLPGVACAVEAEPSYSELEAAVGRVGSVRDYPVYEIGRVVIDRRPFYALTVGGGAEGCVGEAADADYVCLDGSASVWRGYDRAYFEYVLVDGAGDFVRAGPSHLELVCRHGFRHEHEVPYVDEWYLAAWPDVA